MGGKPAPIRVRSQSPSEQSLCTLSGGARDGLTGRRGSQIVSGRHLLRFAVGPTGTQRRDPARHAGTARYAFNWGWRSGEGRPQCQRFAGDAKVPIPAAVQSPRSWGQWKRSADGFPGGRRSASAPPGRRPGTWRGAWTGPAARAERRRPWSTSHALRRRVRVTRHRHATRWRLPEIGATSSGPELPRLPEVGDPPFSDPSWHRPGGQPSRLGAGAPTHIPGPESLPAAGRRGVADHNRVGPGVTPGPLTPPDMRATHPAVHQALLSRCRQTQNPDSP